MSTVRYQCDTCKREIDLIENKSGLTTFGRCVITDGCRGRLYKISRNPNNIREFLEEPTIPNIKNRIPRRAFFSFTQNVPKRVWQVRHDLGNYPAVVIYDTSDTSVAPVILARDQYNIVVIDDNTLEITFNSAREGIIHCISRSTKPLDPVSVDDILDDLTTVTHSGVMNLGVLSKIQDLNGNTVNTGNSFDLYLNISIQEPNQQEIFCREIIRGNREGASAWSDWKSLLSRKRRVYNIKTFNIKDFVVIQDMYDDAADIPDGTRLKIISASYDGGSNYEDIRSRNIIGLLSDDPHTVMDKVRNKLYDIGDISRSSVNATYQIIGGELYIPSDQIEIIYPSITDASSTS